MKSYPYLFQCIKLLLVVLFVYTATSKMIDLDQFREQLARFPYISDYAPWIAFGVPLTELVVAGLLLLPPYASTGLWASMALLATFTVYILMVLRFSDSIPCSCGGIISTMGWRDHILFNGMFIGLALLGLLLKRKTVPF